MPPETQKRRDTKSRLSIYCDYLDSRALHWSTPDIAAYRDYLFDERGLSAKSVASYVATVRGRYKRLLLNRDLFFAMLPDDMALTEKIIIAGEWIQRVENAIDARVASVSVTTIQDRADKSTHRLTLEQIQQLLEQCDMQSILGQRDRALLALAFSTGVREFELAALDVNDLKQTVGGHLALRVKAGKGNKQRLVLYGKSTFGLDWTEYYLENAGIDRGPVFRGFFKGTPPKPRPYGINVRTLNKIFSKYGVEIDNTPTIVTPHDARRSAARLWFESGMPVHAIQKQLGHENPNTTWLYIGDPDIDDRLPNFNLQTSR